jgi:hypothetical protein
VFRFDIQALYEALDRERQARGLSWRVLAAQINEPFKYTTSIPISEQTIKTMTRKQSVASAVVLQVLRWLGRAPESFLAGRKETATPEEYLPHAGHDRILRFDTEAIYTALDGERRKRGLTWVELSRELPGFTPGMLSNLANGPLIGFPRVMFLTQWLGRPAAAFVRARSR